MIKMRNIEIKKLRSFGITIGFAFIAINGVLLLRGKDNLLFVGVSALFFLIAFIAPVLLNPLYIFWMKLAFVLSWISTRLILCLMFYFVFTPIGLILKLLRKDLLDRKIDKAGKTYWKKKERKELGIASYEKQF